MAARSAAEHLHPRNLDEGTEWVGLANVRRINIKPLNLYNLLTNLTEWVGLANVHVVQQILKFVWVAQFSKRGMNAY